MRITDLYSYENVNDEELINTIFQEIDKMKSFLDSGNIDEYWNIAMKVNSMIIEIKNRNLKIDEELLVRKILKK